LQFLVGLLQFLVGLRELRPQLANFASMASLGIVVSLLIVGNSFALGLSDQTMIPTVVDQGGRLGNDHEAQNDNRRYVKAVGDCNGDLHGVPPWEEAHSQSPLSGSSRFC